LANPFLSLIIPAHNEARRLPHTLEQVLAYAESQPYSVEVLVVENGSQDETLAIARQFARQHAAIQVLQEPQPGKGLAVRRGMLAGRGAFRFMADADLSMPIQEVNRFLPPRLEDFDIAIGSREAPGAIRYHEPLYRHLGGRVINTIIRWLALPGLQDTQCGFKCLRGPVADDLFHHLTLPGWSFDIELLYIARRRGYRIQEVPIPWYFDPESKLRVVKDAVRMIADIFAVRRNARQGLYDHPAPHSSSQAGLKP
jgi:glycosyltransferase involved in cell wall biosynthesis